MVTSGISVRSIRFFLSCGSTLSGNVRASAMQASENPMRHAVFAHCNFDFHAGVVYFAEHFLDATNRLPK